MAERAMTHHVVVTRDGDGWMADGDAAVLLGVSKGRISQLRAGSAMVISGQAMPSGTRLSIGYFQGHVRMMLIEDGAPLSCSSTFHQPAVRITPSGTAIRG
jgi:hypothetical protein